MMGHTLTRPFSEVLAEFFEEQLHVANPNRVIHRQRFIIEGKRKEAAFRMAFVLVSHPNRPLTRSFELAPHTVIAGDFDTTVRTNALGWIERIDRLTRRVLSTREIGP